MVTEQTNLQNNLSGEVALELDFYRIRSTIAEYAASEEGKTLVLQREPCNDEVQIEALKDMGREWYKYISAQRQPAIVAWPCIKPLFPFFDIENSQFEQDQIFALGIFCNAVQKLQEAINSASITSASSALTLPILAKNAQEMPTLQNARQEIFSIIDANGQVKDLPALRAIRSKMNSLRKEIESIIRRYTTDSNLSNALQSTVPAFKADRELLAVRSDRQSAIKGIVHEVSASGQTVYIEPEEIVKANNDLVQLEYEYQNELKKIFRELTAKLSEYKEEFLQAHQIMITLDSTCACAKWQKSIKGIFAQTCNLLLEPPTIKGARHPLLGEKAVPVDIQFMDGKKVLIITGPNTGGKTVTLKTIALFSLLNQAGFPIPAEEGTRLPIFSSVFADIGDEQSIDESLSTFSAHMKKVANMVNEADSKSLILLDELGSGTDPQEGGAIAMAVLDTLIKRGSFIIVTTHHGILKNYGYTNKKCINASVEFDTTSLRPTYKLLMGVPGESHAIDIALHSGLSQNVIAKAREYISTEQADVSSLIKGLSAKHTELDSIIEEEKIKEAELQKKELKLHEREIKAKERELKLKEEESKKSSEFLKDMRKKLENLVRELREGEITREKTLSVKKFIAMAETDVALQDDFLEAQKRELEQEKLKATKEGEVLAQNGMRLSKSKGHESTSKKKSKQRLSNAQAFANASAFEQTSVNKKNNAKAQTFEPKLPEFAPGAEVLAGSARRKGVLVSKNKNGSWCVQFGVLKMNVPQQELMLLEPSELSTYKSSSVIIETDSSESDNKPKFELRLLGLRYEDAMKALERQLDLCAMYNFREFSIIHGKGTGILQQGVQNYLSHYPGVKEFHFASPEDGGTGKTYVTLY